MLFLPMCWMARSLRRCDSFLSASALRSAHALGYLCLMRFPVSVSCMAKGNTPAQDIPLVTPIQGMLNKTNCAERVSANYQ